MAAPPQGNLPQPRRHDRQSPVPADAWQGCRRSFAARRPPIWAAFEARMFEHGTPAARPRALVRAAYEW